MTQEREAERADVLRTAINALDNALHDMGGCGDGNCIIAKPNGMHTNGGCRCPTDQFKMQRFAYNHNLFAERVRHAAGDHLKRKE